ncbi:hypothetical protein [Tardiphaga robiniae]|uniref:hypothetical protein n=1 Tax=Tardiphaga robiniae TaxID=943830 RepID=UPI001586E7B6|nr:hypothetical protein [Tardiphaga robiniae]NUU44553.1 hypothetical protein [Tardiphaga robiniae]
MTVPQVHKSQRELRVLSEEFENTGERLLDLYRRDVIANAYDNADPDTLRRLMQDVDGILPTLADLRDRFAVIARPATEVEIGDHLAVMRLNFHNSKAAGAYASIMVDRAIAKAPSFAAIEWATRDCIDTRKFMPVTAEVLEMIANAQGRLNSIRDVIATLPARRAAMAKRIE